MTRSTTWATCLVWLRTTKAQCLSERATYNAYREEHLSAYNACQEEHAYSAYREKHLSAYNACRKQHLTMRIQRASRLQCLSKVAFLQCVSRGAIPLACGRLEPGLWLCGRLNKLVTGPVAVFSENAFGWGRGPRRS